MALTAEDLKSIVCASDVTFIPDRVCQKCGFEIGFIILDDEPYYMSSCGCGMTDPKSYSWADVLAWIEVLDEEDTVRIKRLLKIR